MMLKYIQLEEGTPFGLLSSDGLAQENLICQLTISFFLIAQRAIQIFMLQSSVLKSVWGLLQFLGCVLKMVNNNTNFKFLKILSIFTIWYGFSLKAISCYCPFNSRLSEALFEQMWRYTAQWSEETFRRCSRQRRHSKEFVQCTVRERYWRAWICKTFKEPRNPSFRLCYSLAGQHVQQGRRTGQQGWKSIPGLL